MLFEINESNELVIPEIRDLDHLEPYQMTVNEFMYHTGWVAYVDPKATGEQKGNYKLKRPNGKDWRGGWIGKFKNENEAKKDFHKEEIRHKIHWGHFIEDRVFIDYPLFKQAQDEIKRIMGLIHLSEGDYGWVEVNGERRIFCIQDYPLCMRVSGREFVSVHQLIASDQGRWTDTYFSALELTTIAMEQRLSERLPEDYRPHFQNPLYNTCLFKGDIKFKVVTEVDELGNAISFKEVNGNIVYNTGSCFLRVEYIDEGETKFKTLFQSELLEIMK